MANLTESGRLVCICGAWATGFRCTCAAGAQGYQRRQLPDERHEEPEECVAQYTHQQDKEREMNRHVFRIMGSNGMVMNTISLTPDQMFALFSVYKLCGENRVTTIKSLRSTIYPGLGLLEAKRIVDLMAERASLDDGTLIVTFRPLEVLVEHSLEYV